MEDAQIKMEAEKIASQENTVNAENLGYQHDHEDCMEFLWEFLETLAPDDFQQEGYFEAYVNYNKNHRHAREVGEDPDQVEF